MLTWWHTACPRRATARGKRARAARWRTPAQRTRLKRKRRDGKSVKVSEFVESRFLRRRRGGGIKRVRTSPPGGEGGGRERNSQCHRLAIYIIYIFFVGCWNVDATADSRFPPSPLPSLSLSSSTLDLSAFSLSTSWKIKKRRKTFYFFPLNPLSHHCVCVCVCVKGHLDTWVSGTSVHQYQALALSLLCPVTEPFRQSWPVSVFLNFFNNKNGCFAFFIKLITYFWASPI